MSYTNILLIYWNFLNILNSSSLHKCYRMCGRYEKNSRLVRKNKSSITYLLYQKKFWELWHNCRENAKNMTIRYRINCCECDETNNVFYLYKIVTKKLLRLVQSICTTKPITVSTMSEMLFSNMETLISKDR